MSSGLLSPRQLHVVMKNVFSFTSAIGQSLETRFPEMEFVLRLLRQRRRVKAKRLLEASRSRRQVTNTIYSISVGPLLCI